MMSTMVDRVFAKHTFETSAISTNTAIRLLDDISELAPEIISRAAEIETARCIPLDMIEALRSIGVFRMFVPRSHGGLEFDLPTAQEIIAAFGRIDGSVGWTAMIGCGATSSRLCCRGRSTSTSTRTARM